MKDIDDQSHSGFEVKNFMIGPVFCQDDPTTPVAIIQFINKLEDSDKKTLVNIGDGDRAKFDSMQKLLGMCVDNTNDMSNTIKMSFDVSDIMKRINSQLSEEKKRSQESETQLIFDEITAMVGNIRDKMVPKLADNRREYAAKLTPYTWKNGEPVDTSVLNPKQDEK